MVSFQAPQSPTNGRKPTPPELDHNNNNSSIKRKLEDQPQTEVIPEKRSKPESSKSFFEIDLHLESPLPSEWQRCLDIQSGKIHFYNTRTHKKTSRDPRRSSPEPSPAGHMSLELELNLPRESQRKNHANDNPNHNSDGSIPSCGNLSRDSSSSRGADKNSSGSLTRRPSWLAAEGDDQGEMVATVCTRCHMLVMLCKASPACPNCKFIHPPDQTPPKLFNPSLSLLC